MSVFDPPLILDDIIAALTPEQKAVIDKWYADLVIVRPIMGVAVVSDAGFPRAYADGSEGF